MRTDRTSLTPRLRQAAPRLTAGIAKTHHLLARRGCVVVFPNPMNPFPRCCNELSFPRQCKAICWAYNWGEESRIIQFIEKTVTYDVVVLLKFIPEGDGERRLMSHFE